MNSGLGLQNGGAPEITSAFVGARFGLVGFPAGDTETITSVLADLRGLSSSYPASLNPMASELRCVNAVILNCDAAIVATRWVEARCLGELSVSLVAVGKAEVLARLSAIQECAAEMVTRPFSIEEFVFRVWRGLNRDLKKNDQISKVAPRKPCVLVADDDGAISMLAMKVLTGQGFECHSARNGKQALEMARKLLPDLVILDVNMPLMNGFDVLTILRNDPGTSAMKVVIFTGNDFNEGIVRDVALKANGYLCKPFRPFDFTKRIKEILQDSTGEAGMRFS